MLSHRTYLLTLLVVVWCIAQPSATAQFIQQGSKLVGTGAVGSAAYQGQSVSLSADGNTAIVGGFNDNSGIGAAWVYTRSGGVWSQQGSKLFGTGADGSAEQGYSVCLSADGNTAIVGGYFDNIGAGAAWVYTRYGGVWSQQGSKLFGTGAVGSAYQGQSVSLSADGNTAIVGGYSDSSYAGAAWVYTRSGGVWSQQGSKLFGTGAVGGAAQGISVSLSADGNTAIVGGPDDNSGAGATWVFTRSGGVWSQQGSKLFGTGAVGNAGQGQSVSLSADGNTAIVGGYSDNSGAGAAWVYTRSGVAWNQQGSKLFGTGAIGSAYQGQSVSLSADGDTAIVGGYNDNSGAGAAWVYTRSGGVWSQQRSKLVGTGAAGAASQGISVSLSADGYTAIVGGNNDSGGAGAAWVWVNGAPNIAAIKDVANDQGGKIRVMWDPSRLDCLPSATVRSYNLWMGTKTTGVVGNIGSITGHISTKAGPPERTVSDAIYWQSAGSVAAHWLTGYSSVVSTYADSGLQGIPWYYFQVTAQAADSTVFWTSNIDSGYSVDNIPPDPPASMSGNVVSGTVDMKWKKNTEPDMWRYAIYRSTASITDPSQLTPLATTDDTTFADSHPITGSRSYYAVCAQDIHGNQSIGSNQISFIPSDFTLSVSVISFTASALDYGVRLDWKTGSETNNAGFIVMREMEGDQSFREIASYTSDVALKGLGTSTNGKSYSYTDNSIQAAGKYTYELENVTTDGITHPYIEITVDVSTPTEFALFQNYPNPFNPNTTISFNLKEQSDVALTIYNMLGQQLAAYNYGTLGAGRYQEEINMDRFTSGVYYYRLDANGDDGQRFVSIKKLVLMK